jgi:hypothetical protein
MQSVWDVLSWSVRIEKAYGNHVGRCSHGEPLLTVYESQFLSEFLNGAELLNLRHLGLDQSLLVKGGEGGLRGLDRGRGATSL